jgi:hypothetical protein
MTLKRKLLFLSAVVGLVLPSLALADLNLVVNGGFETGDFTGWTTQFDPSYPQYVVTSPAHTGAYAAQIAGYDFGPDILSQTIATTPGQIYNFSFWRYQEGPADPTTSLTVTWDGATIFSEVNPANADYGVYQGFSASVTGTGSDLLAFTSVNNPSYTYLDDVSVAQTPEPGFYGVMAMGLCGLVVAVRRRNRA